MADATATTQAYLERFAAQKAALPGAERPWLAGLREQAIACFGERGFPSPREELWKYTNLRPLLKQAFEESAEAAEVSLDRLPSLGLESERIVMVNGRLRPELSRLAVPNEGLSIASLEEALASQGDWLAERLGAAVDLNGDPLAALNTAMMRDGLVLRLGRGLRAERPIEILHMSAPGEQPLASHPRLLVWLEEGAEATLIEQHDGIAGTPSFTNMVSEIVLAPAARLRHITLQRAPEEAFLIERRHVGVGRDARYLSAGIILGAALSRSDLSVRLEGRGAECLLAGSYALRGKQHGDITTRVDHLVPDTRCSEVFRGALDDKARGVFQGKLVVHPDAQRSDGHQSHKALLLSDGAEVDAKPELEIYADDVKCSHGATAGEIDAEALFYLRSRGIAAERARSILVRAFLGEAMEAVAGTDVHERLMAALDEWLAGEDWKG